MVVSLFHLLVFLAQHFVFVALEVFFFSFFYYLFLLFKFIRMYALI